MRTWFFSDLLRGVDRDLRSINSGLFQLPFKQCPLCCFARLKWAEMQLLASLSAKRHMYVTIGNKQLRIIQLHAAATIKCDVLALSPSLKS